MNHSTSTPTRAQKARFQVIRDIGCLACRVKIGRFRETQVHHLLSGSRRIGHDATIGLCPWHHMGTADHRTCKQLREVLGPSLMDGSKKFHAAFGTDRYLLDFQNGLIAAEGACADLI